MSGKVIIFMHETKNDRILAQGITNILQPDVLGSCSTLNKVQQLEVHTYIYIVAQ